MQARQRPAAAAPLEQRWELTAASPGQKLAAIALGAANLVGVLVLSSMLADPYNKMALARNGLLWVASTMPFLQASFSGGGGGGAGGVRPSA